MPGPALTGHGKGVAAWCQKQMGQGFSFVRALSSTSVEALAVLQAVRWAKAMGIRKLRVLSDTLQLVNTLCNVSRISIRSIIMDILDLVFVFDFVSIIKANR